VGAFNFVGRVRELEQFAEFVRAPDSGFTHLRGRRRIGKTELLRRVRDEWPRTFYFMGRSDESNRAAMKRFARDWDAFTGKRHLTRLRTSELSWDELFGAVSGQARVEEEPLILLFDEIQWMAAKRSGFVGLLKQYWGEWRKLGNLKVVLCGSSNRFFHTYTDGEMAALRGLRTHASIFVEPFSLAELRSDWFPNWTSTEICLTAMMMGGVPYYLENLPADDNFIRAVDRGVFSASTIFLEEVDALLKLETMTAGSRKKVKGILATLGENGATQAKVVKATGLPQNDVHKTLDRLLDYGLIVDRRPLGPSNANRRGVRYAMEDPYLNFYFTVLEPLTARIRSRDSHQLFPTEVLGSNRGYYIEGFTGSAFERLIGAVLERGRNDLSARAPGIFQKLKLRTGSYEWGTYWSHGKTQIDIVVRGLDDREVRIIEAKWTNRTVDAASPYPEQVLAKMYDPQDWRMSFYLALSAGHSQGFGQRAARMGIGLIDLEDLF